MCNFYNLVWYKRNKTVQDMLLLENNHIWGQQLIIYKQLDYTDAWSMYWIYLCYLFL